MNATAESPDKIIWMFWDKGRDAAPEVVKLCIDSWIARNPTWRVIVLDDATVSQYADIERELGLPREALPIQKFAVMLRLSLLANHGGVWADSTTYCMKPLDEWLPPHLATGFFAFSNAAPDRLLSNWFLAARKGDYLATEFHRITGDFFRDNSFPKQNTPGRQRLVRRLGRFFNTSSERTRLWFSWPVRKLLRVYPYFVNHYLFAELLRKDARCRAQWQAVLPSRAGLLHVLQDMARQPDGITRAREEIARGQAPMYKLNWRTDGSAEYWSALIAHFRSLTPQAK